MQFISITFHLPKRHHTSLPASEPTNTLVYIVTKSDLQISYDLKRSVLSVLVRDGHSQYKVSGSCQLTLYMWLTLTVSWERTEGLRVYVNGRQLGHVAGVAHVGAGGGERQSLELTLGKADGFEDIEGAGGELGQGDGVQHARDV